MALSATAMPIDAAQYSSTSMPYIPLKLAHAAIIELRLLVQYVAISVNLGCLDDLGPYYKRVYNAYRRGPRSIYGCFATIQ